jgi:Tol biopolymer transport system component
MNKFLTIIVLLIQLFSSIQSAAAPQHRIIFRSAIDAPKEDPDFIENPQRYFELYSMNPDGSDIQRVTNNLYYENQPDVSPDGKTIVCSVHLNAGKVQGTDPGWEIALIDIGNGNLTLLTDNDYLDYGAHWNHDGSKIVYVSDSAKRTASDIAKNVHLRYDIYVMNPDGTGKTQITFAEPGEVNADPSFSSRTPSKILYVHSEGYSGAFDMYIMDADGGNRRMILGHGDTIQAINDPMFNKDDTEIVFGGKIRESPEGNPIFNIFTIKPDGDDLRHITHDDGESDVIPQFSPDDSMIAYYTYVWEINGNTHRIRVINSDGSQERTLSKYPWESDPSWYTLFSEENDNLDDENSLPGFGFYSIIIAISIIALIRSRHRIK